MSGLFITFEGTECSGKSTQIALLAERLKGLNLKVTTLREPGGTPIGEEIRHTLKHSPQNHAMTAEAELLLMNASRAQLVREAVRPALNAGMIVLCDRFYDSTVAYQGHGRGLDLGQIRSLTDFAVGETRPDLTLLLITPLAVSQERHRLRIHGVKQVRDRMEEAGREFFARVEKGYHAIAAAEPGRIKLIDAAADKDTVHSAVWKHVEPLVKLAL